MEKNAKKIKPKFFIENIYLLKIMNSEIKAINVLCLTNELQHKTQNSSPFCHLQIYNIVAERILLYGFVFHLSHNK